MRKLLLLLPLLLAGCGSDGINGDISKDFAYQRQPIDDAPQPVISDLKPYVPAAGDGNEGDWTVQLTGLPFVLNDVVWDGQTFIAVGDMGAILTSADGIDWAHQESGTGADLNAISSDRSDVVAVGDDATVLISTDHGASWTIRHSGDGVGLSAVVINPWQIVAGGNGPFIMTSVDRGESWTVVESLPQTGHWVTDLAYAGGLYIATTDISASDFDTLLLVSVDGEDWQQVVLQEDGVDSVAFLTVLHDGTRFIAAGYWGRIISSPDGYIWTALQTPFEEMTYESAVWTGSELMVAGGITWWYWWLGTPPFERPSGLSSTDGGATWETVNIGDYFDSNGLAWGNGRYVSVGQDLPNWGEGAIYTSP